MESPGSAARSEMPTPGRSWYRRLIQTPLRLLRELLLTNALLKILSFALAGVLWAMVAEDQFYEERTEVYLELKRPPTLVLLDPPSPTISVRVMAPRSKLKNLRSTRLELPVDISDAKPGELVYNFVGRRIRNLPSGVEVTAYSPASLTLHFDERMVRTLPVRAQLEGDPAAGFRVDSVTIDPTQVTVVGPRSLLKGLREVSTEPIKLTDARRSLELDQPLAFRSPHLHVDGRNEDVHVKVTIDAKIEARQFVNVPIELPVEFEHFELKPAVATVVLEGPKETIDEIKSDDVRIFLVEGKISPTELAERQTLHYPSIGDRKGLPRLKISWPKDEVISLKRLSPTSFELREVKGGQTSAPPERRRSSRER